MNVLSMVNRKQTVPSLHETCALAYGPVFAKIRRRVLIIYALACLIAITPSVLKMFFDFPPQIAAVFLGILVPGGGFFAAASPLSVALGVFTALFFFTAAFKTLDMFGDMLGVAVVWIGGMLGGLLANTQTPSWAPVLSVAASCIIWTYWAFRVQAQLHFFRVSRDRRLKTIDAMIEKIEKFGDPNQEKDERELSKEAVEASRYLFDLCLDGKGYDNFDKHFFSSLAAYRYQFSYVGYALMTLQCKYTPNFHGYLNEAQRFLIDGFTRYETCGYWKWECLLGYWKWNPDPVVKGNVMLTGWAAALIAGYEANTGDQYYENPDSLRFMPFKNRKKTYNYVLKSIIESFVNQISAESTALIPCEPHMQFPICNSYAIASILAYDRYHHSNYAEKIYEKYIRALSEEFCDPNGDMAVRRHMLTGLRFVPKTALTGGNFGNISVAQPYHPVYPGLAKRCYAIVRDEVLEIKEGVAYMKETPWEKVVDMGTHVFSPGLLISLLELTALEFGDYEMASALVETEKKYLTMSKKRFKYKDVSVCGMANLAAARWNRKNDWYDTILKGPPPAAYTGPLLGSCSYPDVLVAKAYSSGDNLELVLYNGTGNQKADIVIERLQKNTKYRIKETRTEFISDSSGKAALSCVINGRTALSIVPA
jgi:hypothetical protein